MDQPTTLDHPGSVSSDPVAAERTAADRTATDTFTLLAGVVVIAGLYFGRDVLIPITLSILLSFILVPIVELLRRMRLGRVPAVLLAVLVALGVILGFGTVIGSQVAQLAGDIPKYAETVEKKVEIVRNYTTGRLADLASKVGRQAPQPGPTPAKPGGPPSTSDAQSPARAAVAPATAPADTASSSPLELAQRYLSPILSPIATLGIVFVVAIFILLQRDDLRDRFIRLFGATGIHRTTSAIDDAGRRLSRYFLTQLAINASFGLVVGIGLFFIGVPNPVLWGMLSALMRFVPYIGSFISAGLPIALAAAVEPGWSMAIWTAALYLVVELTVSQAIEPLLYGHSTGLSPFAVVVSAIFWSWLWGPIGLILSMPLTLCLVVLGAHVERLAFLEIMLGDRPALTPVESFYQRVLAGDADNAQDHAEAVLKTESLSRYYDDVLLPGLKMASIDAERAVLTPGQLERIRDTAIGLITELGSHDDAVPEGKAAHSEIAPPLPHPEAMILCVAGRGPLDDVASGALAQILVKHGLPARTMRHAAASREAIATLDVTGVTMMCVSYLELTGTPSNLRFLMSRLRRRLPGVPILAGLWPTGDTTLTDDRIRASVGADYYATSLQDAVRDCLLQTAQPPQASRLTAMNASDAGMVRTAV